MNCRGWKQWVVVLVWVVALGMSGCGEDPQQLFETAQFEEKQNNQAHARELYERVIQASPDSEWAQKAQERMDALNKGVAK